MSLQLDKDLHYVGKGKERTCYVHPEDPQIAIKINHSEINKQTKRELKYYRKLTRRKNLDYTHIPRYLGSIKTNYGKGQMYNLIRDYDDEISRSLLDYLEEGIPLAQFEDDLEKLRRSFVKNQIIFSYDMSAQNILYKKTPHERVLVVIDGLGDNVFIPWLNVFKRERLKKIDRRWNHFITRLRQQAVNIESNST